MWVLLLLLNEGKIKVGQKIKLSFSLCYSYSEENLSSLGDLSLLLSHVAIKSLLLLYFINRLSDR